MEPRTKGGVEDIRLEAKDTKKIRGQGHKKNPRPRTAFPRTEPLEAKPSRGQGQECSRPRPRTQPKAFSKKKRSSKTFFRQSPIYRRSQNF